MERTHCSATDRECASCTESSSATADESVAEPAEDSALSNPSPDASLEDAAEVSHDEFLSSIHDCKDRGCAVEEDVPCDLKSAMSTELVEWRHGRWEPTGKIVDNTERWGVRVRFTYWGRLARCLTGDIKITVWWDGFGNLPEGRKNYVIGQVDPCKPHRYVVVIPMTGELQCPHEEGVYDIAVTLDFVCCRKPVIFGHCDLEAIRVTC